MTEYAASPQLPSWPVTDDAVRSVFERMLADGSWGRYHGPHCDQLREALAEFHSVDHVILCSSGTAAVELALRAAQVQPSDEVVLCAYDYKANFANTLTLQARPVLIDSLPGVPAPDITQLRDALTDHTRAVVCSHLHGCFAEVDRINEIARERGIIVIEDACQATGGVISGRAAGAIGDIGVLSFGGSKLLTAGRGGAILTNDATLAQRIRLYTRRGNDAYPLSEMQAAVLLPQLQQLPDRTRKRAAGVQLMLNGLSASGCLTPALNPASPVGEGSVSAFYKVAFGFDRSGAQGCFRQEFTARVRASGIAIDPAFPALHRIHGKSRFRAVGDLPHATQLHNDLVTLHHPVLLSSDQQLSQVTDVLNAFSDDGGG